MVPRWHLPHAFAVPYWCQASYAKVVIKSANGSLLCLFQTQLRMPPTISIHLSPKAPRRQESVIRGCTGWFMWTIAVILVVLSLNSGWWVQIRRIIMLCFAIYVASTLSPILPMKWSDGSYPSTIRVEPIMGKWWPPVGRRGDIPDF